MMRFPSVWKKQKLGLLDFIIFAVIAFVAVWFFVIAPFLNKIPSNFSYKADVVSVDNFFDQTTGEFKGEEYSKTIFSYDVVGQQGKTLLIKNTFDVRTLDGKQVYEAKPIYAIDAYTGAHVKGLGDKDREGYLFAPRGLKKGQSFVYWHADSNIPATMKYVGEEKLYGLTVYKYQTDYGGEIDQTKMLSFLPDVGETKGIKLASTNTLWVEPVSGYLVKQQDESIDYYYYDLITGKKLSPYNQFSNRFAEESVKKHVGVAVGKKNVIIFARLFCPVLLLLCVALLSLLHIEKLKRIRVFLSQNRAGILVFGILCVLTWLAVISAQQFIQSDIQTRLESDVAEVRASLREQSHVYIDTLFGASALFYASDSVTREEWKQYTTSIKLADRLSAMREFGFAKIVQGQEKADFEKSVQAQGLSEFSIHPASDKFEYVPVLYAESFHNQTKTDLGYDWSEDPVLLRVMNQARDSGEVSLSKKIHLPKEKQVNGQSIVFMIVPVYKNNTILNTPEERRQSIRGFVYALLDVNAFMQNVALTSPGDVDFHVYDGLKTTDQTLLFDVNSKNSAQTKTENLFYKKIETFFIAGHPWTVEYINDDSFEHRKSDLILLIVTISGGMLLTLLGSGLVFSLSASKRKAVLYAVTLNKDLQKISSDLAQKNNELAKQMEELEKMNRIMIDRELAMAELKKK